MWDLTKSVTLKQLEQADRQISLSENRLRMDEKLEDHERAFNFWGLASTWSLAVFGIGSGVYLAERGHDYIAGLMLTGPLLVASINTIKSMLSGRNDNTGASDSEEVDSNKGQISVAKNDKE